MTHTQHCSVCIGLLTLENRGAGADEQRKTQHCVVLRVSLPFKSVSLVVDELFLEFLVAAAAVVVVAAAVIG